MRKKIVLTSLLTVAMCLSLIVGATFALFGSESKKNIAVTSGKIDVSAKIVSLDTYSRGTATQNGEFANGGSAEIDADNAGITVDRMSPGDKIVVKIDVENNSNIAYRQRATLRFESGTEDFFGQLVVGVSEDGGEYDYFSNYATEWTYHEANTTGTPEVSSMYISVELPEYVSENWQDKSCDITFAVEAIQGNATTEGEESRKVYLVEDQAALEEVLGKMQDEETVVLSGGAWEEAEISYDDDRTIYVRGYKVNKLTVDAPAGEVHYYNDANEIIGEALAGESLHVYGNVGTVTVKRGHAVMEAGASAEKISVVPAEGAAAQIDVAAGAEVQSISVDAAAGTKAEVSVAEGASVPEMIVTGDGEITLGGEVERTIDVWTEEALRGALGVSGTVTLRADIETADELKFLCDAALDLNGHTLTVAGGTKAIKSSGGKTLTVQGNGTVYGALYADKEGFKVGSTLIVNAGENFSVQSSSESGWAVYGAQNTDITLNGGTYSVGDIKGTTGIVHSLGTYLEINDATVNVTAESVINKYGIYSNAKETYLNDVTVNAKYSRAVYLNNSLGKTVIRGGSFTTDKYTNDFEVNPTIEYWGTLDISDATITRVGVGILYFKSGATEVEGLTESSLTFVPYGDSAADFLDIDVKK